MSLVSKKRRRARRGGLLGHLSRIADMLKPRALPSDATMEQAFADAVVRGWPIYAHPGTAAVMRANGLPAVDCMYMAPGQAMAMKPNPDLSPLYPLSLR